MIRLFCILFALVATSCAKTVYLEKEKIVEVKEYVTHTDTIFIPKINREEVATAIEIKDTSRLETTHAMSEAFVANGQLHHSLWQKPETFKFDIQIPTLHQDCYSRLSQCRYICEFRLSCEPRNQISIPL